MVNFAKCLCALASTSILFACAVGPNATPPETPITQTDTFENAIPEEILKEPKSISKWWERIDDPKLTEYVNQLLSENLALKEAGERIIQARERVGVQRGDYFPAISATGDASRVMSPPTGGAFNNSRLFFTNYGVEASASWQLDLFGRIQRSVESAEASLRATEFDKEALTHSLIAELLNRRIAVATNKQLLKLAIENEANRENIQKLVRNRYNLGTGSTAASDVFLAEENFATVQADTHNFTRLLADEVYALDVLLGQKPGTTDPYASRFPMIPNSFDVPTCLPIDLLDRRPDLRASELRVQAATADVGIAVADLYPSITIGGTFGVSGEELKNLFTADQLAGSILSSITTRIFEGGRLRANIRLQESRARELAANYANTVLEAMRDVESALNAERGLVLSLADQTRAVEALQKAEDASKNRYIQGIQTLQQFLDIQQRRYAAEQNLVRSKQQLWNARISVYLALGGDWFNANTSCTRKVAT